MHGSEDDEGQVRDPIGPDAGALEGPGASGPDAGEPATWPWPVELVRILVRLPRWWWLIVGIQLGRWWGWHDGRDDERAAYAAGYVRASRDLEPR